MRIAVCDDEAEQIRGNVCFIQKWAEKNQLLVNVDTFSCAEEFLLRWSEGQSYDLAIFDIKMRKMTGIDLAKVIRKTDQYLQIVFITGIAEHVFEGYNVSALNYLVKPYSSSAFTKTLDKAYAIYKQAEGESLIISQGRCLIRVPYSEIQYMEIRGHYFEIFTLTMGDLRTKKQMSDMLSVLDKGLFIQCHRSYIVNVAHIASLDRQEVRLKSGKGIPLSQSNTQLVTKLFLEYHYDHGASITI